MHEITKEQAKQFILKKQGLINHYKFTGKEGILEFVKQAGCIQFDPVDVCGKNVDLVLFSRVEDYQRDMLDTLLYDDRELIDQWDKNMSIYPSENWYSYHLLRQHMIEPYEENLIEYTDLINRSREIIFNNEFVTARDLSIEIESSFFTWRHKKLSQAILDYLFFKGDVIIHHREGIKRFFGLSEKYLSDNLHHTYLTDINTFYKLQIKRRIGSVGMLWSSPSDAFLGIFNLKTPQRKQYFHELVESGQILPCRIAGINEILYILKEDEDLLNQSDIQPRVEFIAALDNMLWDRKLIKKIFDFSYTWEIYTPEHKRIYGFYTLPILYGLNLIGRIDMNVDKKNKTLVLKGLWFENDTFDETFWELFNLKLKKFMTYSCCDKIDYHNLSPKFKALIK